MKPNNSPVQSAMIDSTSARWTWLPVHRKASLLQSQFTASLDEVTWCAPEWNATICNRAATDVVPLTNIIPSGNLIAVKFINGQDSA